MPIQSCGQSVSASRGKAGARLNAHTELRAKRQRSAREAIYRNRPMKEVKTWPTVSARPHREVRQDLQAPSETGLDDHAHRQRAAFMQGKHEYGEVAGQGGVVSRREVPRAALCPRPLHHLQTPAIRVWHVLLATSRGPRRKPGASSYTLTRLSLARHVIKRIETLVSRVKRHSIMWRAISARPCPPLAIAAHVRTSQGHPGRRVIENKHSN